MRDTQQLGRPIHRVAAVGICLSLFLPQMLNAQESVLTTSTQAEFGGAFQFIMNLVGMGGPQINRMMFSGPASTVRSDDFDDDELKTSSITNFRTGDVLAIDHEDESYIRYNFGDFLASGAFQVGDTPREPVQQDPEVRESDVEYSVEVEFDSPGDRREVLGYDAERFLITLTATATKAPEGQSLDSMPIFKMLTELWVSEDFPANEAMAELSDSASVFLQRSVGLDGEAMSQAFAFNPQFADAFEQNEEELAKMQGVTLEQLSAFVSLTPGTEFNPDSALHGSMGELKIDVAGAVASGIRSSVTRRLGGIGLGRRSAEPEEPEARPAVQTLMFRMHERVVEYLDRIDDPAWMEVPAGYVEKENPMQRPVG